MEAVRARARKDLRLVVARLAPAPAEGHLVHATHPVAVDQRAEIGAIGGVVVERAVPDAAGITVARYVEPALRIERESVADIACPRRQEHVVAENQVDLSFVEGCRPALVPRGLGRAQRARAASNLGLVAA